jgi:hypothetical protein
MQFARLIYHLSVLGAAAGLACWGVLRLLVQALPGAFPPSVLDVLAATILGATVSGLAVAFGDKWSTGTMVPRWVFFAVLIGLAAGCTGGLLALLLKRGNGSMMVNRVLVWSVVGALIGFGLGMRSFTVNRARVVHAILGGLLGGTLGGLSFAGLAGRVPDVSDSLAYMLLGFGICCGVVSAPVLMRTATLSFLRSNDARAIHKLGRRRQWELQENDMYIIGSLAPRNNGSSYRPEVEIYLPDALVAERHAKLYSQSGQFYLARHENIMGSQGQRYYLEANGRPVIAPVSLHDGDNIIVGGTTMRLEMRQRS